MREILVYDDYEIHKLGAGGGTQYEEVTTEKATSIYVTDVAKTKGKLIPFGRTYQKQLEGYNLFDYAQVVNLAYGTKQDASGNYILQNKKYRGYYIQVDPNVTYIISRKSTTDFSRFRVCCTEVLPVANVPVISESIVNGDGLTDLIKTIPENGHYLFLYLSNNDEDITPEMEIQITKSEELLPYEPYVGGQASPSPDFPQEIQNVEGRSCRNLFNKDTTTTGYRIAWATGEPYAEPTAEISDFIEIKGDTDYILTNKCYIIAYDDAKQYLGPLTNTGIAKSNGITTSNFKLSNDVKYVKLLKYGGANNFIGFQMNEGNTLLPYEPYFEGKRLEFNVCNKNLLKVSNTNLVPYSISGYSNYTINDSKESVEMTGKCLLGFKCRVKPNTQYTVQYLLSEEKSGTKNLRVREFSDEPFTSDEEGKYIGQTQNMSFSHLNPKKTFTTTKNTKWLMLIYYGDAASSQGVVISNWQVAEGTDSTYVEHNQQLIPFPLADGQKLMEGDYLAEDGVHHIWGEYTINSPGAFSRNTAYDKSYSYFTRSYSNIILKTQERIFNIFSNKLIGRLDHLPSSIWADTEGRVYFDMPKTEDYEDILKFRNKIQEAIDNGDPYIIQIPLAEEVIDPYTEEQAKAYNKLKNLMLYKGVNHIWTNTDGLEPNLQLTYKRVKQEGVLQVSNIQQLNNLELNNTEETPEEITTEISEE